MTDEKITLLLDKEALRILDEMVENSGCGSRGRTIQLMVETVARAAPEFESFLKHVQSIDPSKPGDELGRAMLAVNYAQIMGMMSRFLPRKTPAGPGTLQAAAENSGS